MCQLMRLPHIAVNMNQFPDGERLHSEQSISSQSFIRSKTRSRPPPVRPPRHNPRHEC